MLAANHSSLVSLPSPLLSALGNWPFAFLMVAVSLNSRSCFFALFFPPVMRTAMNSLSDRNPSLLASPVAKAFSCHFGAEKPSVAILTAAAAMMRFLMGSFIGMIWVRGIPLEGLNSV